MEFVNKEDYIKQLEYENKRLREKLNAIQELAHTSDIHTEAIDKNYDYYKNNLEEINKKYTKRYVLIHDCKVYGEYDTYGEAVEVGKNLFDFNNFIVQENIKTIYPLGINAIEDDIKKNICNKIVY